MTRLILVAGLSMSFVAGLLMLPHTDPLATTPALMTASR